MHRPRLLLLLALVITRSPMLQAQAGTCFRGPIRTDCSGFVLFEGTAVYSRLSPPHTATVDIPLSDGSTLTLINRFKDLPSYYGGSLGYIRVVGPRTAIGAVAELAFSNESDLGNSHRVAITARVRRQLTNATFDIGAGPLGAQVFIPSRGTCCSDRTIAYGATVESALMYRGYVGLTAGADLVHGAGRTSGAVHGGVRVGSYGAVAAAIATAITGAIGFWALSHSSD